ncbi:hypothetical protein [Treponema succinifaciens]|uniref:hypothetical protein n=1 Tax=Treponema succinifaciens TaxID=167 RepID=UPI003F81BA29
MKTIDYRKRLSLNFDNDEKIEMLQTRIYNMLFEFEEQKDKWGLQLEITTVVRDFSNEIGKMLPWEQKNLQVIYCYIIIQDSITSLVFNFITFFNVLNKRYPNYTIIEQLQLKFLQSLDSLNIKYEKELDDDGIFIFPKGAEELDDALVSEPLDWMKDYPSAHGAFIKALKAYAECTENNASDVSDLFRKALESFFQEFFNSEKSLENMISDYGSYLKNKGIPKEISNNFEKLLNQYTDFMNNYAKHHDKTSVNVLEYIMYQTGNIIRLLITLKKLEIKNAN